MMILGASALQVPAIKKAKELGYQIILVDYDENAVGFALADVKLVVSTLDQEEVYRQALIYQPDVVITSTSDGPVRTAAYVNEKLGKRPDLSYENALCATIKNRMRDRLKECGVPIPEYYAATDYETFSKAVDKLHGNCIVKPADNAGSRGVVLLDVGDADGMIFGDDCERGKCDTAYSGIQGEPQSCNGILVENVKPNLLQESQEARLKAYLERYNELKDRTYRYSLGNARNGTVMVEEYMHGPEVSVEIMVIEGEPHILTITDKYITPPPYFVELAHCEPSGLDAGTQEQIRKAAAQAVRAIGIENAPAHVEIKVTQEGPKIVELAARLGGDFITSRLVPLSTGIDMVGASVLLATGETPDLTPKWNRSAAIHFISVSNETGGVLARTFDECRESRFPAAGLKSRQLETGDLTFVNNETGGGREGVISRIIVPDALYRQAGVEEISLYKQPGDRVHGTQSSNDRLGHVITTGETPEQAMELGKRILAQIRVELEPGRQYVEPPYMVAHEERNADYER